MSLRHRVGEVVRAVRHRHATAPAEADDHAEVADLLDAALAVKDAELHMSESFAEFQKRKREEFDHAFLAFTSRTRARAYGRKTINPDYYKKVSFDADS